jgi:hypothetical protein
VSGVDALIDDIGHSNTGMAFLIYAFPIDNQQNLRGFVLDFEVFGDFVGDRAEAYEIEIIEVDRRGLLNSFEPTFDEGAGGASSTVFKNELRSAGGPFANLFQLVFLL